MAEVRYSFSHLLTLLFSHERLIKSILRVVVSLYICLIEQSHVSVSVSGKALAGGLVAQLRDFNFVATLFLFDDVLAVMCRTCRLWQSADLDLSGVNDNLQATLALVHSMKDTPLDVYTKRADELMHRVVAGVHNHAITVQQREQKRRQKEAEDLKAEKERQQLLASEANDRNEPYKPAKLKKAKQKGNLINDLKTFSFAKTDQQSKEKWDKYVRQAWLSAVEDDSRAQFPNHTILSAFDTCFNPSKLPEKASTTYGKAAVEDLIGHYGVPRGGKPAMIVMLNELARLSLFVLGVS